MPDVYQQTCLHEASHCIAALAMGVNVSRIAVDSAGDSVAGECFLTLPDDPLHATAILLAGLVGVNGYSHMLHSIPGIEPKQHHVESKRGHGCIYPPETNHVSCETWAASPEPLGWGRDGYTIATILSTLPDASDIFNRADMLSRRILAENHRVLMTLTRRLAEVGELGASDFSDVAGAVIPYSAGML